MQNENPKIAILGYGAMGKEVEFLSKNHNFTVTNIFDIDKPLNENGLYDFDVAIDFTYPDSVVKNVEILAKLQKNIVIGTTGWLDNLDKVKSIANDSGIGIIYGSNFSIGVQMLFKLVTLASKIINNLSEYDIMIHELHHHRKKDSPSGTALSIADRILENIERKTEILTETSHGAIKAEQLHLTSARGGEIAGTHTIMIDSAADTIELTHRSKNRSGLALGALRAANWIYGKKGVFEFSHVFDEM